VSDLDRVFPNWDFRERHATRVDAPPERVFEAVRTVTLAEMGTFRVLARLRGIRAPVDRPLLEVAGPAWSVLADEPGRELVFGAAGQPWKLRGGLGSRDPSHVRMAINWRLEGTTLSTETRVLATDAAARRKFRLYWLVIRPFSGLIRRVWLRAIKRRAQRPA